jgi:alcohol dehydrogenase, propanol-preferring
MKAAILRDFKQRLSIEEVERPHAEADEVLIQVDACGVCHSDLHVADGDWTQLAGIVKRPLILGHEIAGRVVGKGSAVRDLQVGDRVGVPWIHWSCGQCEFCQTGNENLCLRQKITRVTVDGGYAEFVKAPASHSLKIPDGLSCIQAAPLLAVFGIGGLEHLAVQVGQTFGAEVTAIDIADEKLALARSLGATHALNGAATDVVKHLRREGGGHLALVSSAAKGPYDMAFYCLRPTGTLLVVGLPAENICLPPILMAAGEIHIQTSAVGTRQDLHEVIALAAAGKLHCQLATLPLDQANHALDLLRRGQAAGRIVLTPS